MTDSFRGLLNKSIKDEDDFIFCVGWIKEVLALNNVSITTQMSKEITGALRRIQGLLDEKERTITRFLNFVQHNEVKAVMRLYSMSGSYGKIFDGDNEKADILNWVMYEMGEIMKRIDDVFLPALSCLFHRVEKNFNGSPQLIIIDEGHQVFKNENFSNKIMEWLRTLRKKNCSVIFATQEISQTDSLKAMIDTLLNACQTSIFLPNNNARQMEDIYKKFGLTDTEINLLEKMVKNKSRLYYVKSGNGSRVFDLELDKEQLAIIRGE